MKQNLLSSAKISQKYKSWCGIKNFSFTFEIHRVRMSIKLVALVLVVIASAAYANPTLKSNYIEQENSCRQVCGLCDCDGFYCEDECICECKMEEDESMKNLQCIADMKKECDANGLEYELLMQDSAKERFLRQTKDKVGSDFSKHLMISKQKRGTEAAAPGAVEPADSFVGAAAPSSDPVVAAPAPEEVVGVSLDNNPFAALQVRRVLIDVKQAFEKVRSAMSPASTILRPAIGTPMGTVITVPTPGPISLPVNAAPAFWKGALSESWRAALADHASRASILPVQPALLH